jgi:hypothetical protein
MNIDMAFPPDAIRVKVVNDEGTISAGGAGGKERKGEMQKGRSFDSASRTITLNWSGLVPPFGGSGCLLDAACLLALPAGEDRGRGRHQPVTSALR